MTDLQALKQRVESADPAENSLALDTSICIALQWVGRHAHNPQNVREDEDYPGWLLYEMDGEELTDVVPTVTRSVDAALALVERLLPGCQAGFQPGLRSVHHASIYEVSKNMTCRRETARGATPALAILSALLSALLSKGSEHHER